MTQDTDGRTLDHALAGGAALTETQVLAVAHGLLSDLARAHEAGAVRGPVSPGAVVLRPDGSVGLVETADPPSQAYVAPEVLTGRQATAASDVYSAAALLAHAARGSVTLPPTAADLGPTLGWLLSPALAIDPSARPAATDMLGAVEQAAVPRYGPDWRRAAGLGALVTGGAAASGVALAGGAAAASGGAAAGVGGAAGAAGVGAGGAVLPAVAMGAGGAASGGGVAGGLAAAGGAGGGAVGAGAGGAAAGVGGSAGSTAAAAHGVAAQGVAAQGAAAQGAAAQGAAAHGAQVAAAQGGSHAAGQGAGHAAGGLSKGLLVKAGAGVGAGVVGATTAVVVLTGGSTEKFELDATADIYLAGASAEVAESISDPGSKPIKIDLDGAGKVTFPKVSGELAACNGCEPESVDGGNISFASTGLVAFNGITGVVHADRTLFTVGLFYGEGNPDRSYQVDLTDADEEETQEPKVGEVFFIGDGKTGDGEVQEVVVPDGAETLYIGFADGYSFQGAPGAYGDNSGTVDIEVTLD